MSFTGWMIKCIAQAVSEDKQVQAYGKGRSRFVVFDDVDVSIVVEREVGGDRLPLPYVVRKANEKSFRQIHDEIRAAQMQKMTGPVLGTERLPGILKVFQFLPSFLRRIGWWKFRRDPFLKKQIMGTVGVTSLGMFGKGSTGWPINIGFYSLEFAIGGISEKPRVVDGKTETREYLSVTVMFDHNVIDGAPAARFTARLAKLVQDGFGLAR